MRTKLPKNIKSNVSHRLGTSMQAHSASTKRWDWLPGTPTAMRAVAVDRFGPPSALLLRELPVPKPGPQEVLMAIHTAGVGSWDTSIRDGSWRTPGPPRFPLVPGVDGAGLVVAKGSRVRGFRVGDRVYAYEFGNRQGGFYAEFAAVDASHVGRVPTGLSLREAGAAVTPALTALQGINALRLRPRETVLIFGASGAVGTLAVQFAVHRGAHVVATASGVRATRLVTRLGARRVIDAREEASADLLRRLAPDGLDGVLALAGGAELERCLDFVRPRGRVVHPNGIEPPPRHRHTFRVRSFDAVASPREFAKLARHIRSHGVRVPIAAVYPLAQAARAHRRMDREQVIGRMVLQVRRSPD